MDRKAFMKELEELGLRKGMDLMVHSSLRRIEPDLKDAGTEAVIDSLLEILGPGGTLLAPTITGGVKPDQPVYHAEHTPSTVGYFTNALRGRPEAVRSLHPVHSVAALGARADFFTSGHHLAKTPWSEETPYGRLMRDENCRILFLGVNLNYNSCFHALEIEARLPGMCTAESTLLYAMEKTGGVHEVHHHWHDSRTKRFFQDMEWILNESGCISFGKTGKGISRLVHAAPMRETIMKLLRSEPWLMTRPPADNTFVWA